MCLKSARTMSRKKGVRKIGVHFKEEEIRRLAFEFRVNMNDKQNSEVEVIQGINENFENVDLENRQQTTLWIYLYRCSKLGPRSVWYKQKCSILEEQTRTICDKVIRHRMERVAIDHSPIKSPTIREKPSDDVITCLYNMIDLMVASNPGLYDEVTSKLNIATSDERAVCRVYSDFAESLFQKGITWPLITSLFAFSGSLAAECTKNGRSILVRSICDWATVFVVMRLKEWLNQQGGWDGVLDFFGDFTVLAKRKASIMFQTGREHIRKASSMFIREECKTEELLENCVKFDLVALKDMFTTNKNKLSVIVSLFFITFLFVVLKSFAWVFIGLFRGR